MNPSHLTRKWHRIQWKGADGTWTIVLSTSHCHVTVHPLIPRTILQCQHTQREGWILSIIWTGSMLTAGTKENVNAVEMPSHPCFKKHCHHVKNKLPLDRINKVPNLVWLCEPCHRMVHNSPIPPELDAKTVGKIMKYREKLKLWNLQPLCVRENTAVLKSEGRK